MTLPPGDGYSIDLQRTRTGREAMFLLMSMAMDELGYGRLVWRCQAENAQSHRAATNLGFTFEGTWRNAVIVKGYQRGVSWFSILADEWPARRDASPAWLDDANFDEDGKVACSLNKSRNLDVQSSCWSMSYALGRLLSKDSSKALEVDVVSATGFQDSNMIASANKIPN